MSTVASQDRRDVASRRFVDYHHWLQRVFGSGSARVGGTLVTGIVLIALVGPLFAPHAPDEFVSRPLAGPGEDGLVLGSDILGRDVLSRFLWGGRMLLVTAIAATLLSYLVGVSLGLLSAFKQGTVDHVVMALLDVLLAFPPLLFVLLILASGTRSVWPVVPAVALIFAPRVARIVRGAALEVSLREFVEAAVARGERMRWILFQEVLPNVWPTVLADFGIRFTASIIVIASVAFLGFGQRPPAADWGLMIGENRPGILVQPWVVVAPVLAIALLTIGVNLVGDAIAKSLGRSTATEEMYGARD